LEARMDDIHAVMRATGMERASLFGPTQGGAVSALFAATFPELVVSLVTYGTFARVGRTSDWPFGESVEELTGWEPTIGEGWGTEAWAWSFAGDWGAERSRDDPTFLRWFAKLMRFSATPTSAVAFNEAFDATDVRDVLPTVGVPALLLYRRGEDERAEIEATSALLPISRVVELPPDEWSVYIADPDPLVT